MPTLLVPRTGPVPLHALDLTLNNLEEHEPDPPAPPAGDPSACNSERPELLTGHVVYRRPRDAHNSIRGALPQRYYDNTWLFKREKPELMKNGPMRRYCAEPRGHLQFDSCFESGNLACAVKNTRENVYDLVLDEDTNT